MRRGEMLGNSRMCNIPVSKAFHRASVTSRLRLRPQWTGLGVVLWNKAKNPRGESAVCHVRMKRRNPVGV